MKLTKYDVSHNFRKLLIFLKILFNRGKVRNILFKRPLLKSVRYDFLFTHIKYIPINFYATCILRKRHENITKSGISWWWFLVPFYIFCTERVKFEAWNAVVGKTTPHLCHETTTNHWGTALWLVRAERDPFYTPLWECQAAVGRKTFSKLP